MHLSGKYFNYNNQSSAIWGLFFAQVELTPDRRRTDAFTWLDRRNGHAGIAIDILQAQAHILVQGRRDVLAYEVGADRKFAVTAIDQDGKLDTRWAPEIHERVERGSDRTSGEEHIVHQHDGLVVNVEQDIGPMKLRQA